MQKIFNCLIYALALKTCCGSSKFFTRISTFPVCKQLDATCNTDTVTNAEIVTATADGKTLIYAAGLSNSIGFVDITSASNPLPKGSVSAGGGEPTSVSALGNKYVLACVNTSANYIDASGKLLVIDIASKAIVATFDLGGQPDAIKVSKDGKYAVIAVENERDESVNGGNLPQNPPGYVVVVDIDVSRDPKTTWNLTTVTLAGLPGLDAPTDPEPEYVDINDNNVAAVTLQENNAVVLIDCKSKTVVRSFTAGSTSVTLVDVVSNKQIENTGTWTATREPDGVAWIDKRYFVTADEGDWKGGTRTFTIFDSNNGQVVFSSGNQLELIVTRFGAYPEKRSKKGNEVSLHIFYQDYYTWIVIS